MVYETFKSFKVEQHPVVIFIMFCSLFQIIMLLLFFFLRINMYLKTQKRISETQKSHSNLSELIVF